MNRKMKEYARCLDFSDFETLLNSYFKEVMTGNKIPLRKFLLETERNLIIKALELTNGHQRYACRLLRMKPNTLNQKIKRYNIPIERKEYNYHLINWD